MKKTRKGLVFAAFAAGAVVIAAVAFLALFRNNIGKAGKVKTALEKKYGEKFIVSSINRYGTGAGYFTAQARAAAWPDLPFVVDMDKNNGDFSDGYVMKRGTRLIAECAKSNISGLKGPHYVHVQPMFRNSVSKNPDVTLTDFLSYEATNFFTVYLYIDPSGETPEDIWESVSRIFGGMGNMDGSLEICFSSKKQMDRVRSYVETHALLEDKYMKMAEKHHVAGFRFENGALQTSRDRFISAISDAM